MQDTIKKQTQKRKQDTHIYKRKKKEKVAKKKKEIKKESLKKPQKPEANKKGVALESVGAYKVLAILSVAI